MGIVRTRFTAGISGWVRSRSYGGGLRAIQIVLATALLASGVPASPVVAQEQPIKLVILGDSLASGLGLPQTQAFPARLARALTAKGLAVEVSDAGVSGDTASGGLGRLDWSVPEGTDAVLVELGANDALRGVDPKVTRAALDKILRRLKERNIEVLLAGMQAPRNLGNHYTLAYDGIFTELAAAHGVLLYPFFLDGVATNAKLNQHDGVHPNAAGVDVIVERILPKVEELISRAWAKSRP